MDQQQLEKWRREQRERLVATRMKLSATERKFYTETITLHIESLISSLPSGVIAIYWPFKGEPNLLPWLKGRQSSDNVYALPVVQERRTPLLFREWKPGERLMRGIWNIPIPAEGKAIVPDIIIAPVVGFDSQCFRLGYGGGYYDRTLAAFAHKPLVLGIGFQLQEIASIYPQAYDIPMDYIITEKEQRKRCVSPLGAANDITTVRR